MLLCGTVSMEGFGLVQQIIMEQRVITILQLIVAPLILMDYKVF